MIFITVGRKLGLLLLSLAILSAYLIQKEHIHYSTLIGLIILVAIWSVKYYVNPHFALKYSFTRACSRLSGDAARIRLPRFLRKPVYIVWGKRHHVNFDEVRRNLEDYESVQAFFTREINPRPIDSHPLSVVSPCDGQVAHLAEVTKNEFLDIKQIKYKLGELFTGLRDFPLNEKVLSELKVNPNNKMYVINLYLAPGNYHRYHSPADFVAKCRNHIGGFVRSPNPDWEVSRKNIYEENERVNVYGEWKKGFMAISFIAAGWRVGSMTFNFDPTLRTNRNLHEPFHIWETKDYPNGKERPAEESELPLLFKSKSPGIRLEKGSEIGMFHYGSSIVLLFEAGPDFEWKVMQGDPIKYGQCLGQ